jgi:hypothetical protein
LFPKKVTNKLRIKGLFLVYYELLNSNFPVNAILQEVLLLQTIQHLFKITCKITSPRSTARADLKSVWSLQTSKSIRVRLVPEISTRGCQQDFGFMPNLIDVIPHKKAGQKQRLLDNRARIANSRQRGEGGWAIAQSPILGTTITVERLKMRGYIPLSELYNQIKPNTVLFPMT